METNEKSPKIAENFECKKCDYICSKYSDWSKHCSTQKHFRLTATNKKSPKIAEKCLTSFYVCNCGKSYKHSSSLCKHKKTCTYVKQEQEQEQNQVIQFEESKAKPAHISEELVIQLIKQNKELQQMLFDQSSKMYDIAKDGKYVTNNNTTNNNQFNLNIFLNEQCKDALNLEDFIDSLEVKLQDLEDTSRLGYADGISQIFITGLKKLSLHSRPIHCSDMKRDIIYVKNQNIWEKEDEDKSHITLAIKQIGHKNMKQIREWQKANPEYNNPESKTNDKYMKMLCNVMSGSTVEEQQKNINKIIKNVSKEVVIDKHNF